MSEAFLSLGKRCHGMLFLFSGFSDLSSNQTPGYARVVYLSRFLGSGNHGWTPTGYTISHPMEEGGRH